MKSTLSLRHPRISRPHFPRGSAAALPMTPAPAGSWRYHTERKPRFPLILAAVLALGLHAAVFYGTDTKSVRPRATVAPVEQVLQLEMPALPPEEQTEKVEELVEEQVATVAVPQLAEVPSMVALTEFTQLVDLRPKAEIDPNALRSVAIPVNHGRGGNGLGNAGNLFKLSDLDRIPQVVAQPAPDFPPHLGDHLQQAQVVVSFIVDAEGRVREPRVVSSTAWEFEKAALAGVQRWKFQPGVKGGRKVATLMEVPLRFEVNDAG